MEKFFLEGYTNSHPYSFGGEQYIKKSFSGIPKKKLGYILSKSDTYTKFRQYRKPKFPPIKVYKQFELFEMDLIFFTDPGMPEENDGYQYGICVIDCFTKYAWVIPIKNKKSSTIIFEIDKLFLGIPSLPQNIRTDKGGEFTSKSFKNFTDSKNINLYFSHQERKCAIVERFNLSFKQILFKILFHNSSVRWIDYLNQTMKIYLSRYNRSIKLSPLEASKPENHKKVLAIHLTRYNIDSIKKMKKNKKKSRFNIGDYVRLKQQKNKFSRGYKSHVTSEYFKIYKIDRNLSLDRYYIIETNKSHPEKIIGSFHDSELVLFTPPQET